MPKKKHVVVFPKRAGWAFHAAEVDAPRTACGRGCGGWAVVSVPLKRVECRACRRKLGMP